MENSNMPIITAFVLGLLTALSPCPLATNIMAVGYVSKDMESKHKIFLNGILYTVGRMITYTGLALIILPILREGASIFSTEKMISRYGQVGLSPILIVIRLFLLGVIKVNVGKVNVEEGVLKRVSRGGMGALFLGIVFALAFCPTSGVFYFGVLMPMASVEENGYLLAVVFAIATGLPVMMISWVLAYSIQAIGSFYNKMQAFERIFTKIVGFVFLGIGGYYWSIVPWTIFGAER